VHVELRRHNLRRQDMRWQRGHYEGCPGVDGTMPPTMLGGVIATATAFDADLEITILACDAH
jgi:hypothetical protein